MKFVLVFVDTLRADHLGCYGYERETSPNIDSLADGSVVFERCYATDVPTIPSFTATFAGQRGILNGVVTHAPHETLDARAPWFPSLLQGEFVTAAVTTLYHMKPYFARGFSHYMNPVAGKPQRVQKATADQVNSYAIPWIKEHAEKDFLLFVHYWDVHEYTAPGKYRRLFYEGDETDAGTSSLAEAMKSPVWPFLKRKLDHVKRDVTDAEYFVAQYDAALRYVDDHVGEMISTLQDLELMDEAFVVVASDHGESLGEHSIFFDHASAYEDTVRIPLIVRWPGSTIKGTEALVQNIDLSATILEIAGVEKPAEVQGQSLVPLLEGSSACHREEAYVNQGAWQAKRAIITDRWKYSRCIHHGFWPCPREELFDLSNDPGEQEELSAQLPEVLDEMAIRLRRWEDDQLGRRVDPLSLATQEGLKPMTWVWELVKKRERSFEEWAGKMGW